MKQVWCNLDNRWGWAVGKWVLIMLSAFVSCKNVHV